MRIYKKIPAIVRLLRRVEKSDNGCWVWLGAKDPLGYGRIRVDGKTMLTHRVSYLFHKGEVIPPLELDHLCRNPSCVNPDHLEPVTRKVNTGRGNCAKVQRELRCSQTHCKNGHPLSGENLYLNPKRHRECRTCRNLATKRSQENKIGKRSESM